MDKSFKPSSAVSFSPSFSPTTRAPADGDFLPTSVTSATLIAWYDASDTASITKSGDQVTQINDKSGNGHHATNGTSTGPDSGTRTQNSLNVLDFGGFEYLQTSAFGGGALSQPNTIIAVGAHDTTAAQYLVDGIAFGQRNMILQSSGYFRIGAPTFLQGPARDANFHVFKGIFNDTGSKISVDDGADTTGAASTNGLTGLTIGATYGLGVFGSHNGPIGEIEVYDGTVSDAELTQRIEYLMTKWGI